MSEESAPKNQIPVPFTVRVRCGGGNKTSILVTIPRDVVSLTKIKNGDWVKLTLEEVIKAE